MNKNIEPAYVTFEQARWLKDEGFNENCKSIVENNEFFIHNGFDTKNSEIIQSACTIPEQWQVIEYLEQKGIIIELIVDGWGDDNCVSKENLCYRVFIWQIGKPKPKHNDDLGAFATKQEAYSAAFDYIKNEELCANYVISQN
jgi:hypothetical protein